VREGFSNVGKGSSLCIAIRIVCSCMSNVMAYLTAGWIRITTTLAISKNEGSSFPVMKLTKTFISCWIEVAFSDSKGSRCESRCFKWLLKDFRTFSLRDRSWKVGRGEKDSWIVKRSLQTQSLGHEETSEFYLFHQQESPWYPYSC
jgi:hypothetical protein